MRKTGKTCFKPPPPLHRIGRRGIRPVTLSSQGVQPNSLPHGKKYYEHVATARGESERGSTRVESLYPHQSDGGLRLLWHTELMIVTDFVPQNTSDDRFCIFLKSCFFYFVCFDAACIQPGSVLTNVRGSWKRLWNGWRMTIRCGRWSSRAGSRRCFAPGPT